MRSQRVKRVKRSKKSKMLKRKQINRRTKRVSKVKRSKRTQINRGTKRSRRSQINRGTRRTRRTRRMRGGSKIREKKLLQQSHLTPEEMAQYKTYLEAEEFGGYGTTAKRATTERRKLDALAKQRLEEAGGKMGPHDHSDPPPQPTTESGVSSVTGLEDLSEDLPDLPGLPDLPQLTAEGEKEFELLGSELDTSVGGGARPPETPGVLGGPVESEPALTREQEGQRKKSIKKEERISDAFKQLVNDNKWRVPTKAEAADKGSGEAILGKIIWVSNKPLNSTKHSGENPARGKVGEVQGYNSKWVGASTHTIGGFVEPKSSKATGRKHDKYNEHPEGKVPLYRSSKTEKTSSEKYPFLIKCEGGETPSTLDKIRNWIENGQPWPPP